MLHALSDIKLSQLMDQKLWNFKRLEQHQLQNKPDCIIEPQGELF